MSPGAHSAAAASVDSLTGYGATMSAWNAHHRPAAAYSNVTLQNGQVVEYTVDTKAISVIAAVKRARQELPADSRQLWAAQKGHCYQVELASHAIGQALAAATADPSGGVLAMISTLRPDGSSVYQPGSVNQIMLSPGSYPTPADAPDC